MPGIPREVIEHHLKIHPDARPVRQKPRKQSIERQNFIREEVRKLLQAGFIEEVYHPVWLANPVIVPKANGKLRMCIDYTNLNKACPKDPYPLQRIDQILDSTSGCDLLSFIDAYSGFHQIKMARDDRKHTAFVTMDGLYCYIVMLYGLLNALPTFARSMNITLDYLVRDIVEVYVDDIVIKTRESNYLLETLAQVFDKLRATSTKLNPEKYVFGVSAGKLLGFLVSHRGIEANPDKVRAIEAMRPLAGLKDVQRLTGSLAALSRFISRLAERALPLFKLMRGSGPFTWTEEAERAFQEMKQYLTSLPVLVAPDPGETLFLYLAAMTEVISMELVTERSKNLPQGPLWIPLLEKEVRPPLICQPALLRRVRLGPGLKKHQATWGPASPQLKQKDPVRLAESEPLRSRSTMSARSFMKQRPGILRRISSFMLFSLHPGNSVTIFRPTRL
jgi:hypothetical protein